MRITDITSDPQYLEELMFMGSPCTKDCSGHKAGYKWSLDRGGVSTITPSRSFDNGTRIAVNQLQRRPQGGGKIPNYVSQTLAAKKKRAQRISAKKAAAAGKPAAPAPAAPPTKP